MTAAMTADGVAQAGSQGPALGLLLSLIVVLVLVKGGGVYSAPCIPILPP